MKALLAVLLLASSAASFGQVSTAPPLINNRGTSPPTAQCTTGTIGLLYFNTSSPAGQNIYGCTAAGTWSFIAGGSTTTTASDTSSAVFNQFGSTLTYTPLSAWQAIEVGTLGKLIYQGSANSSGAGHVIGELGWFQHNGTGTVTLGIGSEGKVEMLTAGGTTTSLIAVEAQLTSQIAGSTIGAWYGSNNHVVDASGTISSGLFFNTAAIDDLHAATPLAIANWCNSPTALNAVITTYACVYQPAFSFSGSGSITNRFFILGSDTTSTSSFAGPISHTNTYTTSSSVNLSAGGSLRGTNLAWVNTAPTISSGFGTSPSVASNNGTLTFRVNVGTGGTASAGVIGMPTAATGWNCSVSAFNPSATQLLSQTVMTASNTTTVSVQNDLTSTGAATPWPASQVLIFQCTGY